MQDLGQAGEKRNVCCQAVNSDELVPNRNACRCCGMKEHVMLEDFNIYKSHRAFSAPLASVELEV